MNRLNWAILGPGTIAKEFAKALNQVEGRIYAVGSRKLTRAEEFAKEYGVEKAYGDYSQMLKDDKIDVVYISTPHSNHYEYIIKSLRNGKHVLCEKAITVNYQQLSDILELAQKKNLVVAEAMTIYHMPLYKKLREIIDAGKIGKVKMLQVSFGSCKEYDINNRFFNKDLAGGALLDIGTYALSFARFFLSSQPQEILTTVKEFETGVDEQSAIILKNNDEELAVVNLSMRAKMPKRGVIGGEKGFITVDNYPRAEKAVITYTADGSQEVIEVGKTAKALEYEVEDMSDYIIKQSSKETLDLSIDVMEIMTKVREEWGITYPFE